MNVIHPVMLQVWRETCLHQNLQESTDNLLRLLEDHAALSGLAILEFVTADTLRVAALTGSGIQPPDERTLRAQGSSRWARLGDICDWRDLDRARLSTLKTLATDSASALFCPLRSHGEPLGVAVLAIAAGISLGAAERRLAAALMDPLSTALVNHRRLQELERLRAAAEAGQVTLARKLGSRASGAAIVGADGDLREVMERAQLVSATDLSVLLLGETGSGKEVIARAIHDGSPRAKAPFIRVNCGAIPADLIDSELFGHERGSFTGAVARRQGWFERADGGTLFLDEIGELPLAAQVRLLRVLQEGTLQRVGGTDSITVDVRIIAATHRDLAAMVATGAFREDLWYRIAGFPIHIPPLRQRPNDLAALAEHMARRAADKLGLPLILPTAQDLQLLASYSWPGNVRELGVVMDRAAILGQGRRLEIRGALGAVHSIAPDRPATTTPRSAPGSDFPTLEEVQRRHIEAALERTRGRVAGPAGAAVLLGLNSETLRSRMRKLGIDAKRFRS